MFTVLLGIVEALSKINDIKSILAQERLKTLIEFMEKLGGLHFRAAIWQLEASQMSRQPDNERKMAISHLVFAAEALAESLKKRSLLARLLRLGKTRRMNVHLKITGCYLITAGLYLDDNNIPLVEVYAAKALEAFKGYAEIEEVQLRSALFARFAYNSGTDQQPLVRYINNEKIWSLLRHYDMPAFNDEGVLPELAAKMVERERQQLFTWLAPYLPHG